jgi:hypothetical protein
MPKQNLSALVVRDDETPQEKPRLQLAGSIRFVSGVLSQGKPIRGTETLSRLISWVYLVALLLTKGTGRKVETET